MVPAFSDPRLLLEITSALKLDKEILLKILFLLCGAVMNTGFNHLKHGNVSG